MLLAKNYENCDLIFGARHQIIQITEDLWVPGLFSYDIELYTNKKAVVLGKPGAELGDYLRTEFNDTKSERILFIGDNLEMDIAFGKSLGYQTLLVLTGASSYNDMINAPDEQRPDYYCDGTADFIQFFNELK